MRRFHGKIGIFVVILVVLGSVSVEAATWTVCSSGYDFTTIQAAHDAASPGDIIDVLEVVHTEYGITITKDLTIQGQGQSNTILQAAATPETAPDRVFSISAGATVTISDMTIRNGCHIAGGGLYNGGTLTLSHVSVLNNYVSDDFYKTTSKIEKGNGSINQDGAFSKSAPAGGGLCNEGSLTITDCIFQGNKAKIKVDDTGIARGGALCNSGSTQISNSLFIANYALNSFGLWGLMAVGAGIYNWDTMSITSSTIAGNNCYSVRGDTAGAGIYNDFEGTVSLLLTVIDDNYARSEDAILWEGNASGGGIYNYNTMTIEKCSITNNMLRGGSAGDCTTNPGGSVHGGGIHHHGSSLIITDSTISGNEITGGDASLSPWEGGWAYGGGICAADHEGIVITNSTISDNVAIAGWGVTGLGEAMGGGIYHSSGDMNVSSSTIGQNAIFTNPGGGGSGIISQSQNNSCFINNCIIADDILGEFISEDYNLFQFPAGGIITGEIAHNIYNLDPQLGPLQDNGGPTWTHTLQFMSPAIDAGSCSVSGVSIDQRGVSRPQDEPFLPNVDDGCDIGAFEGYIYVLGDVVVNEVAWSGTAASVDHEWIELYNTTGFAIDLSQWTLAAQDGNPTIQLSGYIESHGFYLLERISDTTISDISADLVYSSEILSDTGEQLTLVHDGSTTIDTCNNDGGSWPGGTVTFYSMERGAPDLTDLDLNWQSNNGVTRNGLDEGGSPINGTPKQPNSVFLVPRLIN